MPPTDPAPPPQAAGPWRPGAAADYARGWSTFWDLGWTRAGGVRTVEAARSARLSALVRHARAHSAFYRDAYAALPEDPPLAALPVVTKRALMARFDDWVADPAIRRRDVDAFLADRAHVGERFLDRYIVWKSSGSTGEPGIYLQDDDALAVYDALVAVQLLSMPLASRCAEGLMAGGRAALVIATGDHFASIASWERARRAAPGLAAQSFSVMSPLPELVAALNAYAPAFVASYPTMLALLAAERTAGRLRVAPSLVWSGGEFLAPAARDALAAAFGCPVLNEYGTSECMSIASSCDRGWLHVNADWVIVEPVDADYRPVAPGATSNSVLLTNLANRVQPILRYDLGDAVVARPDPCPCGSPLPAIRVEGRREDVLVLPGAHGREVRVPPMALTTVVEDAADLARFQIAQTSAHELVLRVGPEDARKGERAALQHALAALRDYLTRVGVAGVHVAADDAPPRVDPHSGKLRQVVIELAASAAPPRSR